MQALVQSLLNRVCERICEYPSLLPDQGTTLYSTLAVGLFVRLDSITEVGQQMLQIGLGRVGHASKVAVDEKPPAFSMMICAKNKL